MTKLDGSNSPIDLLLRYQSDGTASSLTVGATLEIQQPVQVLVSDCKALGEAVESLHRNVEFQSAYMAHQLGQLSDEEFEVVTIEFASDSIHTSLDELARKVSALVRWTRNLAITREEVSTLFSVSEDQVDEMIAFVGDIDAYATRQIQSRGVNSWLPMGIASKQTSSS